MYLADAQLLAINATFWIELVSFLLMTAVLARYAYPRIIQAAEARQRAVAAELEQAEKARLEAEAKLKEAEARMEDARKTAQSVIDSANKSAEQLRQERKHKAEEEAQRIVESARKEIEAEREAALRSVQTEVAGMVVAATEKVIGETLDLTKHRKLIDRAIAEVASGDGRG